jgi:hypothetical protein
MKHLLKSYMQITVVMVINVGLLYALLTLLSPDSGHRIGGLEVADRDNVKLERNLALLDEQKFAGFHANLRRIIEYCGAPDGYIGQIDGDLGLIYYNRFGREDWVAYVTLKSGMLTGISHNDSSVNDHSRYKDWEFSDNDIPTFR